MLRLEHSDFRGSSGCGCQAAQIADTAGHTADIRAGRSRAFASVRVNRVAGAADTDTLFRLDLYAYAGPMSQHFSVMRENAAVAVGLGYIRADADPKTWQKLSATVRLPRNTTFVAIEICAIEDVCNDPTGVEFAGHYADDAFVTLDVDNTPVKKTAPKPFQLDIKLDIRQGPGGAGPINLVAPRPEAQRRAR